MHGSPDGSGRTNEDTFFQRWGIGFLALPILVLMTLIGLAVVQPSTTNWIADQAMAEFTGANYGPQAVPTQLAKAAR